MSSLKRLCVFCGSSPGNDPVYLDGARRMGRALAEAGIGLVYGGAAVGLMGAVADAALAAGGEVIGVMPQALADKEIAHKGLTQLHIVDSMHTRKAMMADLADGFIAMPGGIGTFEELFEVWTWAQLGYHAKPCSLLNLNGFYDGLAGFLDQVVERQFMKPQHRQMLVVANEPGELLTRLQQYQPPETAKWVDEQSR